MQMGRLRACTSVCRALAARSVPSPPTTNNTFTALSCRNLMILPASNPPRPEPMQLPPNRCMDFTKSIVSSLGGVPSWNPENPSRMPSTVSTPYR